MAHCRLFTRKCRTLVRYTMWPVAIISSIAEGMTAIPALADVSFWVYQMVNSNSTSSNSEQFIKENPQLFSFIAFVAACGIATDFLLEGYNAIEKVRDWQTKANHIGEDIPTSVFHSTATDSLLESKHVAINVRDPQAIDNNIEATASTDDYRTMGYSAV